MQCLDIFLWKIFTTKYHSHLMFAYILMHCNGFSKLGALDLIISLDISWRRILNIMCSHYNVTFSGKSSLIIEENKAAICREGHNHIYDNPFIEGTLFVIMCYIS